MKYLVKRDLLTPIWTAGKIFINKEFECFTLEDAVREPGVKVPGRTAIPEGRYRLVIDESARFKRMMPHILDVPMFEGIRIHAGNTAEDTEGCILVGVERHEGGRVITRSREAFDTFFKKLLFDPDKECWIEIQNAEEET